LERTNDLTTPVFISSTLTRDAGCDHRRMNSEQDGLWAEHDEKLVRMMDQAHASSLFQLEAVKLRLAHNEKLVALCAGILALSFTASVAFRGEHLRNAVVLHDLLWSWRLFVVAIVAAVVANWLGITGLANFANFTFTKQVGVHFDILHVSLMKLAPEYANRERKSWERHVAKGRLTQRISSTCLRCGELLGFVAQAIVFIAFLFLYLFAKAVLGG
jgi:hypothetical protein